MLAAPTLALAQDDDDESSQEQSPESTSTPSDQTSSPDPSTTAPAGTADEEEAQEAEEAADAPAPEPLAWRNSFFSWTNGVTANTFAPGGQLSYDPSWVMYFGLNPRWYFTPTTFLWVNQQMQLELTDGSGTYNREPLLYDTVIDLRQLIMWEGFVFQGAARITLPLSKSSQAANRIMQTGLAVTITRAFPELAGLTIAASFGYRRWWATSNVVSSVGAYSCNNGTLALGEIPNQCSQAGGQTTDRDVIVTGLTASIVPIGALTINLSGFYFATYGHPLATGEVSVNGGTVTLADASPTHWRAFTYFALSVGYDIVPWLNIQLGVQNSGVLSSLYNENGSVRSPFNPDTQFFLTGTLTIDALYEAIVGEGDAMSPQERQRRRQGLARVGGSQSM